MMKKYLKISQKNGKNSKNTKYSDAQLETFRATLHIGWDGSIKKKRYAKRPMSKGFQRA